jgi:beta-N-acetylhexosaminidase
MMRQPRNRQAAARVLAFVVGVACLLVSCSTPDSAPEPPPAIRPDEPSADTVFDRAPLRYPELHEDPDVVAGSGVSAPRNPLVDELLESLTLRQRIGQRFIARIPGSRLTYGAGRAILDVAPAGFIVYPWNFSDAADVRRLTRSLQDFANTVTPGISLLLCADQEGGRVRTFRFPEFVSVPSARVMGDLYVSVGADPVEASSYLTGLQMKQLGLNMNLAPVLDVYPYADASIIGDRSYSGDPDIVSGVVKPYLRGAERAGIISVAKHFPGHGITSVDSHAEMPVLDQTLEAIRVGHLPPFQAAIDAGIDVIMTGHLLFSDVDPFYPVTLSRVFLQDVLRGELGYTGVVISDGLEMGAIRDNFELPESLARMLRYDVDLILLYVSYDVSELVDIVEDLLAAGEITEDDINRGARRVLQLKLDHALADPGAL